MQETLTAEDYKILKLIVKSNPDASNDEVREIFEKYKQDLAEGIQENIETAPTSIHVPQGLYEWALYFIVALILVGLATLIFNVFGFVIGLAVVFASLYWLGTRG